MKWLRMFYSIAAMLSLLHVLALAGFGSYLYFGGSIGTEDFEKFAAFLRESTPLASATTTEEGLLGGPRGSAETSANQIEDILQAEEIERLTAARAEVELQQQLSFVNRRMLEHQRALEDFDQRLARHEEQLQLRQAQNSSDSYQKTVETVAAMKSKNSRDFLMAASEADAIKILMTLDARDRKKIFDACKSPEETTWRDRMLEMMLRRNPTLAGKNDG